MSPHSLPKSHESRLKVGPKSPVWDPSWTQKSSKKRPGPKKALPKMVPEAVFMNFLRHLRSKSHSRSILGGSEPSKSYNLYSGSTIFTKSQFSLFPLILTPNGTPNPFILAKKRAQRDPKITKIAEKSSLFGRSKFELKFWTEKKENEKNWMAHAGADGRWPAQCATSVGG